MSVHLDPPASTATPTGFEAATETIESELGETGILCVKFGLAALAVTALLGVTTLTYPTMLGSIILLVGLVALNVQLAKKWYVLVGLTFDLEELRAHINRDDFISTCPPMQEIVKRPRTYRDYAWPALFLLPQALALVLVTVGVTYYVAGGEPILANPKMLLTTAWPFVGGGTAIITGALIYLDSER